MDILAHALYGATFFSRTGLAGGRQRQRVPCDSCVSDWTLWAAAGFGLLPDLCSIGASFLYMLIRGDVPSFHSLPPFVYILYHSTHSLVVAGIFLFVIYKFMRPLAVPALSWPLHIIMDSFSHSDGRWQTMVLYPFSEWHFQGINWWQRPDFILLYWGILPVLWISIACWRRCRPV